MRALRARLQAWRRHPARRLADQKRRLERECQDAGTSRRQAEQIASRFFGKYDTSDH
jgi:hypothetical protein